MQHKKYTFLQWLIDAVFIYIVPFVISAIIVVNEYWPYKPLHNFFGTPILQFGDSAIGVIETSVFLLTVFIFWGLRTVVKKYILKH